MADFRTWWKSPAGFMALGVASLLIGLVRWVGGFGTWPWLQVIVGLLFIALSIRDFRRGE